MALSTYTEIKASVASWLNRSDLTTQIADFISLAEVRINRDVAKLNLVGLEKRATATTTSGDAYLATPTRLLAIKSLVVNGSPNRVLKYTPPDVMAQLYNNTATAKPYAYTVIGDEIKFGPVPDSAYTVEMTYCAKEQPLSGSVATNWFTANAPDLLVYGALMEAEPYMKNDERIATWSNMYQAGLSSLEEMNRTLSFSGSGLEIRVV